MMLPKDWKPLPCPRCERHDIGTACTHPGHELVKRLPRERANKNG